MIHIFTDLLAHFGNRNVLIQQVAQYLNSFAGSLSSKRAYKKLLGVIEFRFQYFPIGFHYGSYQYQ